MVLASALATPQSNGVKALPNSASGHKSGYAAASLDQEAHVAGSPADSILNPDANDGDASGQIDLATQTQDEASGGTGLVLANENSRADGGCSPSVSLCLLRGRYWIFPAGFVPFLFTRGYGGHAGGCLHSTAFITRALPWLRFHACDAAVAAAGVGGARVAALGISL